MYSSIIIAGPIASGTSTAAKNVAKKLNLTHHSAGDFFRQYALDHNIPLYDKEQIPDDLDQKVDSELATLAKNGGVAIDGDYIGYFTRDLKNVLKILITCEPEERLRRALSRKSTHPETAEEIKLREEGLDKKFRRLYTDDDYQNPKFFDLIIDNTNISPEETASKIEEKFLTA